MAYLAHIFVIFLCGLSLFVFMYGSVYPLSLINCRLPVKWVAKHRAWSKPEKILHYLWEIPLLCLGMGFFTAGMYARQDNNSLFWTFALITVFIAAGIVIPWCYTKELACRRINAK